MRRYHVLWALIAGFLGLVALLFGFAIKVQGLSKHELVANDIQQNSHGVYEVTQKTWGDFAKIQGYLTAGERLFQMDLMRRKGEGSLSELFGKSALQRDIGQAKQDWISTATAAVSMLSTEQRNTCEKYADGVNEFINSHSLRWGLEYLILRERPRAWACRDTLLIVMLMTDSMTNHQNAEMAATKWHQAMPESWWQWIFVSPHPWNVPLFNTHSEIKTPVPQKNLWLSSLREDEIQLQGTPLDTKPTNGSNSWAYRGTAGAWLANDPHLEYQVPQLWFPLIYSTPETGRVAGAAIPGLPGVLIGMNEHLSWSITNTTEDVDDILIDDTSVVITSELRKIKVKGGSDVEINIQKTSFGPVIGQDQKSGKNLIRQWTGFHPEWLGLPLFDLNRATDWNSFNQALDGLQVVPLNFTMLDSQGNIGYRVSGVSLRRKESLNYNLIMPLSQGGWCELEDVTTRPRLFKGTSEASARVVTANQKIWTGIPSMHWSDDDRTHRIREVLDSSDRLTKDDMINLQRDTTVELNQLALKWIMKNADHATIPSDLRRRMEEWSGDAKLDPELMTLSLEVVRMLSNVMSSRLISAFSTNENVLLPIKGIRWRGWLIASFQDEDAWLALGLDPKMLANKIIKALASAGERPLYFRTNASKAQHPFVGRVPILGRLFAISEPEQYGFSNAVLADAPLHGPSMRAIWDPAHPERSLWGFPIGQSGHIGSKYYRNWQTSWSEGILMPIF